MKVTNRRILALAGATAAGTAIVYALRKPRYSGIKLKKTIMIDRSAADLYAFWRDLENLPRISSILESVEVLDDTRSRWTALAPTEFPIRWEAEITRDIPNEMIGWRSVEGSVIETAGYVRFEPRSGRGTLVRVALEYDLPVGRVGAAVASLLGRKPDTHVDEMLRRFKQLMESGEVAGPRRTKASQHTRTHHPGTSEEGTGTGTF
jgi:uncharacterized membrane protein